MGIADRFAGRESAEATDRVRQEMKALTAVDQCSASFDVLCQVAGDAVAIRHGLGRVPDGYLIFLEVGGHVMATRVLEWTTDLAFVVADTDNTRVRLAFVALKDLRHA